MQSWTARGTKYLTTCPAAGKWGMYHCRTQAGEEKGPVTRESLLWCRTLEEVDSQGNTSRKGLHSKDNWQKAIYAIDIDPKMLYINVLMLVLALSALSWHITSDNPASELSNNSVCMYTDAVGRSLITHTTTESPYFLVLMLCYFEPTTHELFITVDYARED